MTHQQIQAFFWGGEGGTSPNVWYGVWHTIKKSAPNQIYEFVK